MPGPRPGSHALSALVAARARAEGRTDSIYPSVCFYRVSSLSMFYKSRVFGVGPSRQ